MEGSLLYSKSTGLITFEKYLHSNTATSRLAFGQTTMAYHHEFQET